jgi:hypothetical protein
MLVVLKVPIDSFDYLWWMVTSVRLLPAFERGVDRYR